jgi:RsiW-degrading membrane proteinase PrsW (M82 family)
MLMIFLSIWTCVLILAWLVRTKFRNSEFDWGVVIWFVLAGAAGTFLAGIFNSFVVLSLTPLNFTEGPIHHRVFAFFLGPGMGEEFFKMALGLFALLFLGALTRKVNESTRVIGMVIVALTFAALENLLVYCFMVDEMGMIQRSYLAVPLHACCGMIQGYAVNKSFTRSRLWPMLVGYAVAVGIHTAYDTVDIQYSLFLRALGLQRTFRNVQVPPEALYGPIVVALIVWSIFAWRKTRELTPVPTKMELDEEGQQWYSDSEKWEERRSK